MAGHSKFKSIKHKKGANDAKRSNTFTKIIREIIVAVKGGDRNPEFNPRLRVAIAAAKEANMPKDKVEGAINRGNDADAIYHEVRYEGYGPAGTALIVEGLTDNRNRTASEIRAIFGKNGGHLAESGSVSYMFEKVGYIIYEKSSIKSSDDLLNDILDSGANDSIEHDDYYEIVSSQENFHFVKDFLESKYGEPAEAKIEWRTKNKIELSCDAAAKAIKLLDALEDSDDVQSVSYNFEISDEEDE